MTRDAQVLPEFDFSEAIQLPSQERFDVCLQRVRKYIDERELAELWEIPLIPNSGVSEAELAQLSEESAVELPSEYREFLKKCRYLIIDDGLQIWGTDYQGLSTAKPWVSEAHSRSGSYLVFADYWKYSDGDQLVFDLSLTDCPILAYFHEDESHFENYAPSFSLALWRMVSEMSQ